MKKIIIGFSITAMLILSGCNEKHSMNEPVDIGDDIQVKVLAVKEFPFVSDRKGNKFKAEDGTKFVEVKINVKNIGKETFDASSSHFYLKDDQDAEFEDAFSDTFFDYYDKYQEKEILPHMDKDCYFLYKVPQSVKISNLKIEAWTSGGLNREDIYFNKD